MPEEFKELRALPDLKVIKKPEIKVKVVESESREEVLKVPDKKEGIKRVKDVKSEKKKKEVKSLIMKETYQEVAKIEDPVNKNKKDKTAEVQSPKPETVDKVEGPLDSAIADEITNEVSENKVVKTTYKKKAAKRHRKGKKENF